MCTHLDKTGATYYFRRLVPVDLIGCFTTAMDNPRTEWKRSLRTKDKEEVKRLLWPYVTEPDTLIDDAQTALAVSPRTPQRTTQPPSASARSNGRNPYVVDEGEDDAGKGGRNDRVLVAAAMSKVTEVANLMLIRRTRGSNDLEHDDAGEAG